MYLRLITLLAFFSFVPLAWSQQAPTAQDYMQNAQDALRENDTTSAIGDYLLAIQIDPKNWEAYQNLGGCYIQLRKMDEAKAAYVQSLAINPNNPQLKQFMAQVFGGPGPIATRASVPVATPTSGALIYTPNMATPTPTPTFLGTLNTYKPMFTPTSTPTFLGILVNTATPTPFPTRNVEVIVPPFADVMTPTVLQSGEAPPQHFRGFKPYVFQALPRYNLPEKNSLTLDLGGAIWYGGIQNFNDYFGSNLVPAVSSHAGWEFDAGVDYAIVNEIQVGFHLEGLVSPVTRSQVGNDSVEWDSYCVGGALALKYLVPLNSAMSLIAHVEGGYYTLIGSDITWDEGAAGTTSLGGSAFGGLAELQLELFQVADKSLALDFGLGYRALTFNNLTGFGTTVNHTAIPSPFVNANGTPVYDDFSGPRISMSIRFVH